MSHTVKATFKFDESNIDILRKTVEETENCTWLGQGTYHTYSEDLTGEGFKFRDWLYPCVVTDDGLKYDNFGGQWGKQALLDDLIQHTVANIVTESATLSGFVPYGQEMNEEGQLVVTLRASY